MKRMIISGGSRGLGAALVVEYERAGYEIVELSRSGTSTGSVNIDLSQPESAQAILSASFERLAADSCEELLLFNNAGEVVPIGEVADKPLEAVLKNINLNYAGAIVLIRTFIQAFQELNCAKTIVNVSSGAALHGVQGWSLYCAAKAGIEHFIRTVALEQAGHRYPINAINVSPGLIDTDMQQTIRSATAGDFPRLSEFVEFKASGALQLPELVARAFQSLLEKNPASGSRHEIADYLDS